MTLGSPVTTWVQVKPGSILVGSNNRSVLFGGMGPRHEVTTNYRFQISQNPVEVEEAKLLIESMGAEIASESEWELAYSQALISGDAGTVEELADLTDNYWGKACDGRPFVKQGSNPRMFRTWRFNGEVAPSISWNINWKADIDRIHLRLVIRESLEWPSNPLRLPHSVNKMRVLREEILISLILGIIPSFAWAYFNASPTYIYEGWLNLVFGGIFFGIFTGIFWRPRQPTWFERGGEMRTSNEID